MKEKIVIDITLSTDNRLSKAMQIAVKCAGVLSVNSDKEKGHLVVIGIGVDFFKLMKCIKKKFNCARIVSVEEVKPEKKPDPKPQPVCYPNPCVQYYPVCQPKKIVIDLPVNTDQCRSKAMQIAVTSPGVISVNIDKEKGHLVVIGIGVDFFRLMHCIRRKFKCSRIVSIEEVKEEKPDEKKPDEKKPDPDPKPDCTCPSICTPCVQYYPICQPVYDTCDNSNCSIM
ncbi:hypothetical protein H5410_039261 [Solanum commersonii]|uniref:Uncharacterized protein n=1 Tax=Solanum commersonii TaxID=4109 RepID=A0A9J5YD44_SOLCO|nr:hypothetical protein H5410_039261 [Solanum commersonii]